ncbi:MAG: FUSC family membrane protein, partial [Ferruginibacter sp.]
MNYSKRYINFINGRYVGEGIRITAGILLPSFLMNYFGELNIGFVMSLGALCVSAADTPGASKHRFNGMFACSVLVTVLSILVHYATVNTFLLGLVIVLSGFVFSMLHVYGNRSAAVGIAALLVMVMSLQTPQEGKGIWINAGYILAGGIWYMLYSLVLYRLRPYKFIQQVLSDYIFDVSVFLKLRGDLYSVVPEYDKINEQLLQQQIDIEAQQNMLSDLLFNTRTIVKESTHIGRVLVKTYLEVAELYESVMTTYQQYHLMHEHFDKTGILEKYQQIIYLLSAEMEEISMAIKSGISSEPNNETQHLVQKTRKQFEELRQHYMNDDNVENFVSLGRIQNNLEDMAEKINQLHLFTTYEVSFKKEDSHSSPFSGLAATEDFRPSLFF